MSISMFITLALLLKKLTISSQNEELDHISDTSSEDIPALIEDDNSDAVDSVSNSEMLDAAPSGESVETSSNWVAVKRLSKRISVAFYQMPLIFAPGIAEQEEQEIEDDYDYDTERTIIRDFAYPASCSLHHGIEERQNDDDLPHDILDETITPTETDNVSRCDSGTSLDDAHYPPKSFYVPEPVSDDIYREATALYNFEPETEHEVGMKAGEKVWVQYRQSIGWFVADVRDETGLIPENFVTFVV